MSTSVNRSDMQQRSASRNSRRDFRRTVRAKVFGWDVFVSYRRSEAGAYARALRDELETRGLTVFLDESDLELGRPPDYYAREVRRSRMFLLVGTPGIFASRHVPVELESYVVGHDGWLSRRWMRVFPINVAGSLDVFEDSTSAASYQGTPWAPLSGMLSERESARAVEAGYPSPTVVDRIVATCGRVSSAVLLQFWTAAVLIATLAAALFSTDMIRDANKEADAADDRARTFTAIADSAEKRIVAMGAQLSDTTEKLAKATRRLDSAAAALQVTVARLTTAEAQTEVEQRRASEARSEVRAASLAREALAELGEDPTLAVRLALASRDVRSTPAADEVLMRAYNSNELFYSHLIRDVGDADLSPDGRTIFIVPFARSSPPRLINVNSGRSTSLRTEAKDTLRGGRFIDNGRRLLTWTTDGLWLLWSATGERLAAIETGINSRNVAAAIDMCPSGEAVIGAGFDTLHVWNLRTLEHQKIPLRVGQNTPRRGMRPSRVSTLRCSPDGARFLVRRYSEPAIEVWSADGTRLPDLLPRNQTSPDPAFNSRDMVFSPDGHWIASIMGTQATLWRDGVQVSVASADSGSYGNIAFSPDSRHVVLTTDLGSSETLTLDPGAARIMDRSPLTQVIRATDVLAFNHSGSRLALANREGVVALHDRSGQALATLRGHKAGNAMNGSIERVVWSANDSTILTVARDLSARLWQLRSARFRSLRQSSDVRYGTDVEFTRDRSRIAVEARRGSDIGIEMFAPDGEPIRFIGGHESFLRTIWLSPDASMVLTHSNDRIQLWRASGAPTIIPADGGRPFTGTASLSLDGTSIVYWEGEGILGSGARELAWMLDGTPLPRPDSMVVAELQAAVSGTESNSFAARGYCANASWERRGNVFGVLVRWPERIQRFWIPTDILRNGRSGTLVTRCTGPARYGHAYLDGVHEFVLLDPELIASRIGAPIADGGFLWELDDTARTIYGVFVNQ